MVKKLICLVRGHRWVRTRLTEQEDDHVLTCRRCGHVDETVRSPNGTDRIMQMTWQHTL